jgi:Ca2+-binding RTX toxin-like protein
MFFSSILFLIIFVELSCSKRKEVLSDCSFAEKLNNFYSISKRLFLTIQATIIVTLLLSTIMWLTSTPSVTAIITPEAFAQTDQADDDNNLTCWGNTATIIGTYGSDNITGTASDDVIVTLGGGDTVRAQERDDFICGGSDDDLLFGDEGNDHINGGDGDDNANGGDGDDGLSGDMLGGDPGNDDLRGGNGDDTANGNDGDDNIFDDAGYDMLSGNDGDYSIGGGQDNDYLYGGPNTDSGDAGPVVDLCNKIEIENNCEDRYDN